MFNKGARHMPTTDDLRAARQAFEENEPRDLFYRAATELVDSALGQETSLSVGEAVAILLRTWNVSFYRFHQKFDGQHISNIEDLISLHMEQLASFRARSLDTFHTGEQMAVEQLFKSFELLLGPVGAAKCLHLLAPRFFPLWDRTIAQWYGFSIVQRGRNGDRYVRFMQITRDQCESLGGEQAMGPGLLKALDEYNYCKHTYGWI